MPNHPQDRIETAARRPLEIDVHELRARLDAGAPPLLVDVREEDEVAPGVIPGAVHVRAGVLGARAESVAPDRERPIVLYCAVGQRSLFAADLMERLGYRDAVSLRGGIEAWQRAGYPVSEEDAAGRRLRRYQRHMRIPEIGRAGQLKLLDSRVLVVGAGGLGSPAAIYLAASGVGTLGLIDDDVVDETNLQRQIVHRTQSIGVAKTESAKQTLHELNPDVRIETYAERLVPANALKIIRRYDVVIDGCDNFATKYLVNDACVLAGVPDVYGSILRFEGQVTVFLPGVGPCYRCLYREPAPAEAAPSCAEAGVLGVLPGVIGVLQATEALKLLLGIGRPLVGRLLQYDALDARFREFRIGRDARCSVCGDQPSLRSMDDYEAFRVDDACQA